MEFRAGLWSRPGLQSEAVCLQTTLPSAKLLPPAEDIPAQASLLLQASEMVFKVPSKANGSVRDLGFGPIKNTPCSPETLFIYPYFNTLPHSYSQMTDTHTDVCIPVAMPPRGL